MSGGRFLVIKFDRSVYLRKKTWHADPCSKWETITGCKKNLNTGEGDYVDAFVQKFELDESAIMEAFITKKFQIENYMQIMLYSDDLP